jgi:hypothetical protein
MPRTIATPSPESIAFQPVTFRLPKPSRPARKAQPARDGKPAKPARPAREPEGDPFFGFSRAFYYKGEQRGYWKLIRIFEPGRRRGITLIPFQDVMRFVQSQMKEQS